MTRGQPVRLLNDFRKLLVEQAFQDLSDWKLLDRFRACQDEGPSRRWSGGTGR
jgi:hypothetical protein